MYDKYIVSLSSFPQTFMPWLVTHASSDQGMSRVTDFVCVSVCLHYEKKMAWAINTSQLTYTPSEALSMP